MLLPPRDGAVPGLDEALRENVVEDVLQVNKLLFARREIDELGRAGPTSPRGLVVGEPEFASRHGDVD